MWKKGEFSGEGNDWLNEALCYDKGKQWKSLLSGFLEYRATILNKGGNFCVYSCIITVVENTLFI